MQKELHEQAEYYRSLGYDETSDEIIELRKLWMQYRDAIESYTAEAYKKLVDNLSDAVDEIQNLYDKLHSAADEYAASGFIMVDTLQAIRDAGVEYLSYLYDENGQLVINEERIRDVIAARTQQLAVETALSYVESLRIAKEGADTEKLNGLLTATESATDATWGLVYANVALLNLTDEQAKTALGNINALRALADTAIAGIGQTANSVTDELNSMKSGIDDILKYTMDMLKQRVNDQITALRDMKTAYSDIIDLKKESLAKDNEAANRQKTMASKMKEIAKLQAKIDAVSLAADQGDRKAIAERASLMEEMEKLQEDLADTQSDYTLEAQKDALDEMKDAYNDEKDQEISILEDSISSYQKLYDMAIEYISNFTLDEWEKMLGELTEWNNEYGNNLESDIVSAWESALSAAQRYGDYISAMNHVDIDMTAASTSGQNLNVGNTNYDTSYSEADTLAAKKSLVSSIVSEMKGYALQWSPSNSQAQNERLHNAAADAAAGLDRLGVHAEYDADSGTWTIMEDKLNPSYVGKLLYECYHTGGVVGGGDVKSNEQLALLKDDEWVLSEKMANNLSTQISRLKQLQASFGSMPDYVSRSALASILKLDGAGTVNNVTNNNSNQPIKIEIGETKIYGADDSTVQQHITVTRDMVNQIARMLRSVYCTNQNAQIMSE